VTHYPNLIHEALALATALLYLLAGAKQLAQLDGRSRRSGELGVIYLGLAAVVAHLLLAAMDISEGTLNLGIYKVSSLIFLTMCVISLATLVFRPLHMLVIAIFPLAALAVLLNAFAPATGQPMQGLPAGLILHVALALVSFGVLMLATLQAALVSLQTQKLRHHQTRGILQMLPPLDMMESMFFELLTAGVLLLSVAMLTGGVFIEDLFGQQVAHKTILTLIAWLIFSFTLVMHWLRGCRIGTAVTLVVSGFVCLTLGFFGSKLVLELIL